MKSKTEKIGELDEALENLAHAMIGLAFLLKHQSKDSCPNDVEIWGIANIMEQFSNEVREAQKKLNEITI